MLYETPLLVRVLSCLGRVWFLVSAAKIAEATSALAAMLGACKDVLFGFNLVCYQLGPVELLLSSDGANASE